MKMYPWSLILIAADLQYTFEIITDVVKTSYNNFDIKLSICNKKKTPEEPCITKCRTHSRHAIAFN